MFETSELFSIHIFPEKLFDVHDLKNYIKNIVTFNVLSSAISIALYANASVLEAMFQVATLSDSSMAFTFTVFRDPNLVLFHTDWC